MQLVECHLNYTRVPQKSMEFTVEFNGTLPVPNQISKRSMEFQGTLRLSIYFDIRFPWTSIEYSMEP